jgi:DNA-binding NarL/FixJ family response regulator
MAPIPGKNLLMVNADPEIEELVASVLDPASSAIFHAPDNVSALALLRTRAFDLILTSEETSGAEDIELLRRIRRVRPHTRLIILTNESTPADVVTSMREHAFSYFSKPFSLDTFADMIRLAIEGPCWDDGIEVISATPEWIRVLARCELKTADRLLQFLDEIADLPDAERHQVATASRELLLNAIEHGGKLDPNKYVEIDYVRARHMVTCRITDPGPGFALDDVPHAAICNPADDPFRHIALREAQGMRPGGFGVLVARNLVDQLIYSEDGNDVLIIKYLPSGDSAAESCEAAACSHVELPNH